MSLLDPSRLASVAATGVLEDLARGVADDTLDRLTRLAARLLGAPTAVVSIVDAGRLRLASALGVAAAAAAERGASLDRSLCRLVVESGAPLVVEDARTHPAAREARAVVADGVGAYAGTPLVTAAGHVLGTLCVMDAVPRAWSAEQLGTLGDLALGVTAQLERRAASAAHARDLRERAAAEAALVAREAEHRALLAALPLIVYQVDPRPPYAPLYVSPGVAALGYSLEEWLAVPDMRLRVLHPDDRERVLAESEAALDGGRAVDHEYRVLARDGTVRWIHDRGDFVRDAAGEARAWQGIMRDVTARHAAERALAESEARYRRLVELSPDAVLVHVGGTVRYANAAAVALLRAGSADALVGRPVLDLLHPDSRAVAAERIRRVITEGVVAEPLEETLLRLDGTTVHCEVTGAPVRDAGEAAVQVIVRDATARRRVTAALRASEARFRAALEGGKLGFVALAPVRDAGGAVVDFDVVAANRQAAALLAMPEEDLVGQRYGELVPLSRAAGHVAAYARALATREPQGLEVRVTDPRFAAEWLRVEAVALDGQDGDGAPDGAPDGVALMVRDVSAEKRAEREVRLLADVTRALAAAPTLAAAAATALEAMCTASGWEYGEAWLVRATEADASAPRLVRGPVWHRAGDVRLARFARESDPGSLGAGEGLPGRAWAQRTPAVLARLDDAPGGVLRPAAARAAGLESGVAIPVLADGEVIAVLTFHTRDVRRVGQAPVTLLAAVAAQVGTVMGRTLAEAALAEREARLALIYNSATDLMFLMRVERDATGAVTAYRCESVNEPYLVVTGLAREQVLERTLDEILPPDTAAVVRARYDAVVARGGLLRVDEEWREPPTGAILVETTLTPILDDAGACTHILGAARDVSATRRAEGALRESESRFRSVLENLRSVAVQVDTVGRVTFVNQALCALTGWTREESLGVDWFARFAPEPAAGREAFAEWVARGEIAPHNESELVTSDGGRRTVAWDNVLLRDADGHVTGAASVGQDVTERRALEAQLAALSEHDELCGLLNRRGFRRLAAHALRSAPRSRRRDAVLYVDLDRFKPINDTYGHAAGDETLRAVAGVIRATIRDADLGARIGGDEFAIYALDLHEGDGEVLAARLRANLDAHNAAARAAGRPFGVALSVGVAELAPDDDLDTLLARADAALYAEKLARRA